MPISSLPLCKGENTALEFAELIVPLKKGDGREAAGGRSHTMSHFSAYNMFREAMRLYEEAERLRPAGNDEALLRWNTFARTIMTFSLKEQPVDDFRPMLE